MQEIELEQGPIVVRDKGSGPTVVFLHGLLVNGELWRDVVAGLPEVRSVVPDLPLGSHSRPMRPGADLTPRGVARLVADLLVELDLDDVTLVGNDTGGALAQMVAAHHPERIGRLVLTNCDAYETFPPAIVKPLLWLAKAPALATAVLKATRLRPLRRQTFLPFSKRLDDQRQLAFLEPATTNPAVRSDLFEFIRGVHPRHTLEAAALLRGRDLPVLLPWAVEDRFFTIALAERLARDLRHARIERIEDSRTFTPVDQPRRLAELIGAFVGETADRSERTAGARGA